MFISRIFNNSILREGNMKYGRRPSTFVCIRRGVSGIIWAEQIKLSHSLNFRRRNPPKTGVKIDNFRWHSTVTICARQTKGRFDRQSRFWNKTISRNYFGWSNLYWRDPLWRTHRASRREEHALRINAVSVVSATFCISFSFLSFARFWQENRNSVGQLLRSRNNPFLPPRERLSPATTAATAATTLF